MGNISAPRGSGTGAQSQGRGQTLRPEGGCGCQSPSADRQGPAPSRRPQPQYLVEHLELDHQLHAGQRPHPHAPVISARGAVGLPGAEDHLVHLQGASQPSLRPRGPRAETGHSRARLLLQEHVSPSPARLATATFAWSKETILPSLPSAPHETWVDSESQEPTGH